MRVLQASLFWTVAAVLVLPAILGITIGICVFGVVALLGLVLVMAAVAVAGIACVPIVWWCALNEAPKFQALVGAVRAQANEATSGN
jgi:hypothetical protein